MNSFAQEICQLQMFKSAEAISSYVNLPVKGAG